MKKMLHITSLLTIILGFVCVVVGIWGIAFTHANVADEQIRTPEDAFLSDVEVRGPLSLKAQADIIREHTLHRTDGKRYAEMSREIPLLDSAGDPILDPNTGEIVMVANEARNLWITATSLMTALHLAIMSYFLAFVTLLLGLVSLWSGITFYYLGHKH